MRPALEGAHSLHNVLLKEEEESVAQRRRSRIVSRWLQCKYLRYLQKMQNYQKHFRISCSLPVFGVASLLTHLPVHSLNSAYLTERIHHFI